MSTSLGLAVILIIVVIKCESQNLNFEKQTDPDKQETGPAHPETLISFLPPLTETNSSENPDRKTDTVCPVTQMETKGPINLYIHGAFATTNKGRRSYVFIIIDGLKIAGFYII